MSYFSLIMKNPFRNKTRSALAIFGIAIGIATIVALGIITDGLKSSSEETLKTGGSDFIVIESNVSNVIMSSIDEKYVSEISKIEGIKRASGVIMSFQSVEENPYFALTGVKSDDLEFSDIKITKGNPFTDGQSKEIIIGKLAEEKMNKSIGDNIILSGKKYTITGIFESGNLQQDGGAFISLENLQKIQNKENTVTGMFVKIDNGADVKKVTSSIEKDYDDLTTISSLQDLQNVDQGLNIIDTASWAISLLAIVIGGIGVINTMFMSVYERTREIGVLKAVGWKNRRILTMILGESIVLTIVAGIVGIIMGILAIQSLMLLGMDGFIKPVYNLDVFIRGLVVAFIVGIIGGFYPAYRASKLPPTEALRYE